MSERPIMTQAEAREVVRNLQNLLKQATVERSHFYVAACCREAIITIESLLAADQAQREWCVRVAEEFGTYLIERGIKP
jgi:regulator of sirC expression with transglutaminase-like and TPR domain